MRAHLLLGVVQMHTNRGSRIIWRPTLTTAERATAQQLALSVVSAAAKAGAARVGEDRCGRDQTGRIDAPQAYLTGGREREGASDRRRRGMASDGGLLDSRLAGLPAVTTRTKSSLRAQ